MTLSGVKKYNYMVFHREFCLWEILVIEGLKR